MKAVETNLARFWPYLAAAALLLFCISCAHSHLATDPATGEQVVVTQGENILPDVVNDVLGVPMADIVGSAGDALEDIDVDQVLTDAGSGNWLGVAGAGITVLGGIVGGVFLRRRRKRVTV